MKFLHLFIFLLITLILAQNDNFELENEIEEALDNFNQNYEEEKNLDSSEESNVQQILPNINPKKLLQEATKVPTNYTPTGPLTFKDASNQPIMFKISNIDWVSFA